MLLVRFSAFHKKFTRFQFGGILAELAGCAKLATQLSQSEPVPPRVKLFVIL